MDKRQFEEFVKETVEGLPEKFRNKLANVVFIVEDSAIKRQSLLGLYHGIPLLHRNRGYSGVLPDKIILYKVNIEEEALRRRAEVGSLIKEVVYHEIAHYFGMNEKAVRNWEKRRNKPEK